MSGALALVGSGEFLPAMEAVDGVLLTGRAARVAVIPTAAAPEGDWSVRRWFDLAQAHYGRVGAEVVEVDVRDREGATVEGVAAQLDGCGLIYLSGGNPAFLADTLRDTALGTAIGDRWREGAAVAGCSAGAMALGSRALSVRGGAVDGLGLAAGVVTIPHFDRFGFASRLAGAAAQFVTDAQVVIGVDEETAAVWHPDGAEWRCHGEGRVWLVTRTGAKGEGFADGSVLPLPPMG